MLHYQQQLRFTQAELAELERVCGPRFFTPKTVNEFNQLMALAKE